MHLHVLMYFKYMFNFIEMQGRMELFRKYLIDILYLI